MSDPEITRLMDEAEAHLRDDYPACPPAARGPYQVIAKLVGAVRRQDARIAALEAARAPHGQAPSKESIDAFAETARYWAERLGHPLPPLEGTGPLPLERRG